MVITRFDRAICKQIGEELEAAVATVAEKYGLTAHHAGGTFSETEYTARTKLTVTDPAALKTKAILEMDMYGSAYGITSADYGREFVQRGERYRIVGLAPSKPKFPIVVVRVKDNARMGFQQGVVKLIRAN